MTGPLTAILVGWVIPTVVAHKIGESRGRTGALYGLFLSWLGVIILLVLPPLHGSYAGEVQCPDCAEWVKSEARVCRFCGCQVARRSVSSQ